MANSVSHAALPFPVKGARYTVQIPYLDADGDPTDPTTPDTEISKDGAAFADCAEEVSAITGSNGSGYLTLSGAETDCSMLFLAAKVASGPKATLGTFYPRVLPVLYSGTASAGAAGSITLAGCPAIPDLLIGSIVKTTGGTGGGGTGGANNQARVITGYTAAGVASVSPNWETTPDNTTTFEVLLTETSLVSSIGGFADSGTAQAGATATITLASTASATDDIYNYQRVDIIAGTGAGQSAIITDYSGTTKVATVDHAWQTTPDSSSKYRVWFSRVPRDVSKVTGDVEGKILGTTSGGGTISGGGVWAYAEDGSDISTIGGGGSSDWTADEKTAIRSILGVPAIGTTPEAPSVGALSVIRGFIDTEIASILSQIADVYGKVDTEIASIMTTLGTNGDGLSAIPWSSAFGTGAQTAAAAALVAIHLDHLLAVAYDPAAKPGAADALLNEIIGDDSGVSRFTANSLELAPSAGSVTCTELTGVPSASPNLAEAVAFMYMALRNKFTVDSSERKIFNDAGTAIAKQSISDSGGVFTRQEWTAP